jgi:cephalosporin-C deacetylase-like acetyl esterase
LYVDVFAAIASWALLLWGGILGNAAVAQQQQSQVNNQTLSSVQKQQLLEGISFQIDNVTFSHHMASVNDGIQMHYVIGGQGEPVVLLHGWPQSWYEWRHVMPALAKNYTVVVPDIRGLGDSDDDISYMLTDYTTT